MRQRVKLAQAIAHDPEVLLLDEPLSGLDPMARRLARELILRRAGEGTAVVVSSHVLHEVESLTSRLLLIHRGRIAASGEVPEIRALMDRHPHRIRIEVTEPRRLAALLIDGLPAGSLHLTEHTLTVETREPEEVYSALPGLVADHDLTVTRITSPDDRLEAVFDLLVGGGYA
jgi:ABC-2 type transport system ATP-binding protein